MSGELWLVVPARFRGPPRSGNGGWTGGALAAHLPGDGPGRPVTVTLRTPPPLDVAMTIARDDAGTRLQHGDTLVAEAVVPDGAGPAAVPPVDAAVAREAEARYAGFSDNPFPTCFGCGAAREPGDGLRIFPGEVEAVDGGRRVAATWTPHPSHAGPPADETETQDEPGVASLATTWAALDCIGGWSTGDMSEQVRVLGRMTCAADSLPRIGEEHVVVAQRHRTEGRRTDTAATLYGADGRVVARAAHTWIAVDPEWLG